jgi:predicted nuclease of predicted toxin-antitoxin system
VKIKLDENLSKSLARYLSGLGYDVATVVDQGLSGITDPELRRLLSAEGRFLISFDLDFSDVRRLPSDHAGILILRLRRQGRDSTLRYFKKLLDENPRRLEFFYGCLAVADERGIRVRLPSKRRTDDDEDE